MTTAVIRGDEGTDFCLVIMAVLVCWSLDLGSTPDGNLSFSFPFGYPGLCIET